MTDDQIRDLIAKPYKQPAAVSARAVSMAESEAIDTLYGKVSIPLWEAIMAALEKAAAAEIAAEIAEYRQETEQTE